MPRVLIAEDDPTSRMVLKTMLAKWDYQVTACQDGDQAWAELQKPDSPRLAILDWMMPGLDGGEICRRVGNLEEENPHYIILLTALDDKDKLVQGLSAGASDYLTKPFDRNELRARVLVGQRVIDLQASLTSKISELKEAMEHVRTLQGILPICMHCHKIRNDQESWERVDRYIAQHSDAKFSHGVCPECLDKYYPE